MIAVSDAWKDVQQRFILPEMFVEIECAITDRGAQETATATGTNEGIFSQVENITGTREMTTTGKYATLEQNLWVLDGSRGILPNTEPYSNIGYVSADTSVSKVILSLSGLRTETIPGFTIKWSSEYGEYPTRFSVIVKNGNTTMATKYVDDNTTSETLVAMEVSDYDTVEVEIYEWCLPNHRFRVDRLSLGYVLTFTKNEILNYTHEQHGDLNSAELIKHSIEFSVDNTDGRWNPNNPSGLERYLSERQPLSVIYGIDINGTIEWIKAGTFYLSEWRAPANGMEATFVARDMLEFVMATEFPGDIQGSLSEIIGSAFSFAGVSSNTWIIENSFVDNLAHAQGGWTVAETVQIATNAGLGVMRYDTEGILHLEKLDTTLSDYRIPTSLSYSHPEITLGKPLKSVRVSYTSPTDSSVDAQYYELTVGTSGETQTVDNPIVAYEEQAETIAEWVRSVLESRKTIQGEFRADPRLQLFDVVTVEGKYGEISPVVITNLKYTYSGSFKASYTGRVIS